MIIGSAAATSVWEFSALGTAWDIALPQPIPGELRAQIAAELGRIDQVWSRFRSDSVVAEIARAAGQYPVAESDQPMIDLHRRLYEATDGLVTPLVGQTLDDAGYGAGYALRPADTVAAVPAWDDVITGWQGALSTSRPTLIDVGACGKGFAVDRVSRLIEEAGFPEFLVNGSGDIRAGAAPHRIALEHPTDPTKAIGTVVIENNAICGSASNRRAWADWHHIVDPRSGRPTREVLATWVIADDTLTADGLSTALFFCPPQQLLSDFRFDYVVVRANGSVEHSHARELELFL
ncbi:thiamine biosynthesis lipoprotein [Williamsia limnetica]|uniref:FAD:protein FMN transferase n=1 Tax=Williamsia limnetica TaxID=882452 RepID=A0A318S5G0_WILLI|nr:FAD:protein FMN transferase [Williamsia limnetica]PYE19379.1 thiamine biosynthesis lipoprotein [Williamsia limnetica]